MNRRSFLSTLAALPGLGLIVGRPVVIVACEKTCDACPAQWEGRTEDGRYFYARYRHGVLRAGLGTTDEEAVESAMRGDGLTRDFNDMWHGSMTIEELESHLRGLLDFSRVRDQLVAAEAEYDAGWRR